MKQKYNIALTLSLTLTLFFSLFASVANAQPGCNTVNAPIVESFDNYGFGANVLPDCWVRVTNFDDNENKPQISNGASQSTPYSLRMYCGANSTGGHYAVVFTPEIVEDINTLYVRLKIRGYSNSKIEVGVSTDTTNASFTPVDTLVIGSTNVWEEHLVSLSSYTGNGHRIAIRMIRSLQTGNGRVVFIDDMNVEPCGIWNIARLHRGLNDMWLTWDTISTPTVDVEYGAEGFTSGDGTLLTNVTSPLHVTGLSPATTYEFRFSTSCTGGSSITAGSLTETTIGGDTLTLNYCEDFESNGNSLPNGWRTPTGNVSVSTSSPYAGNRDLYFYGSNKIAVLPPVGTALSVSDLTLNIKLRSYYTGAMVEVGVMNYPEDASDFQPVDTVWTTTTWNSYSFNLSQYSGAGRFLALRSYDQSNYYVYADNLELGSCLVSGLRRTNITSHSVEIQWDTVTDAFHGDSVVIEYGVTGFVAGTGTQITVPVRGSGVQTSGSRQSVVVDNLGSDTIYEFIVFGQCDGMQQFCDMERLVVHTLAQDIVLPYCVDFEQYDDYSFPTDWARPRIYYSCPRVRNYRSHSGSMSMQMDAYGSSMTDHSTFVLPLMEVDSVQGLQVSFWGYGDCPYGSRVEVGVMQNADDEATFAAVDTFDLVNYVWTRYVSDLEDYNDTGRYIAIRYFTTNYSYNGYIDDIEVSACAVKNIQSHSETSHGVTIEWEGSGTAYNGAILEFGPHGFASGTGTAVTLDANTLHITLDTLQAGVQYEYRLSSICSGQGSHCDLYAYSFTTLDEPFVATVCETFDECGYYELPAGWTAPLQTSDYPYVYYGQIYMYSYNYGTQTSMMVLPLLEESDLTGLTLRFKASLNTDKALMIGMMTNPLDTSTFETIDSIDVQTSSWTDYSVDLSTYSGSGRHIAFWFKSGYWSDYAYIDNISIERCGVSNVSSYSPTASSVMVRWDESASTSSVTLSYRRSDLPADSTIIVDNATSPYRIEGLDAGSEYTFSLEPHCTGSSHSCTMDSYTFTTLAVDLGDGWCDNGSLAGNLYVYPNDSLIVVLPYISDTVNRLLLSMDVWSNSTSNPEQSMLIVGVCTLPYDISTFVPVDTIHPHYNRSTFTVDFSGYADTGRHIVFKYRDFGYRTTYYDYLSLSRCKATDLRADMITDRTLRLRWEYQPSSADGVWISYAPVDANENGDKVYYTGNNVVISGLSAAETYRFHVWAACQDTSLECQSSKLEVTTLAEPMTVPYCYGFEAESPETVPVGWSRPYGATYPRVNNNAQFAHTGSMSLEMWSYNQWDGYTTSMAVMPMLDPDSVPDISALYVDGWVYANSVEQRLEIGVMTDPADSATYVPVDTVHAQGHRHFKVSLSSYSGSGRYVAFRTYSTTNNNGSIYLDDINLRSCVVERASSRRPTQTSIDITWTAPASTNGVFIEYAEISGSGGGFTPGSGTMVYATQSPYTIGDLTPATYYAFHIYPDCDGENDGCNYETVVNQTLHPSIEIPYCDNFDGYETNDYPDNWRRISTYDSTYNPIITNNYSHSANKSSFFKAYDTLYSLVALPQIDMGNTCTVVDTLYAIFWTRFSSSWDAGRLVAGKITDLYDASTFVPCDTIWATNGYTWEPQTVAFTSFNTESEYIAFKLISTNGYYTECYVDDICLEKCVATEVTVGNITQSSVTITWNSLSVDSLVCEYGPEGFIAGTGTQIVITSSPYVLDGLVDGTQYQFVFASVCGCDQYGEALLPGAGSSGWTYWGGWGWGWGFGSGGWGWGWGWWGGRHWWETPGDDPQVGPVVVPVVTQAADLVVPYCESFEVYDSLPFPNSWRKISGSSASYPMVNSDNHRTGVYSLDFYTAPSTTCIAALPPCDSGSVQEMVMTLSAYSSNGYAVGGNAFVVGVMDDPDVIASFVPVDTLQLDATSTWKQFAVDFAGYSGDGRYIAMRFTPTWQPYHWFVDDLYVGRCAVNSVRTTESSGRLLVQWNTMHSPDSVIIEYGPQGFMESGYSHSRLACRGNGTSSSVFLDNTAVDSTYDIYVYAKCDDTSTLCTLNKLTHNPCITLPYCEEFDGYPYYGYPDNWRTWHIAYSTQPYVDTNNDGRHLFRMDAGTGTNSTIVTLPPLSGNETLDGKRLNIRMSSSSTNARLQLGVLTDTNDMSSFVTMATLSNSTSNSVQEFSVVLTGYTGSVNNLAIKATSISGSPVVWIDRMVFSEGFYPMGIGDGDRGYATRELWWDSGSYYTLEYGWNGTYQTLYSDSCHATLTNLDPGKDYEVYFVSPQGERFCEPYRFTTVAPTALPYCDNFDSYSRYACPTGWRQLNDGSNPCNTSDGVRPRVWDAGVNNSYCLDFYNTCMQIFIMPEFDVDNVSGIGLMFDAKCSSTNDKMLIGVIENPADASTFVPIDTILFNSTYTWEHKTATLAGYSGTGRYVALQSVIGSSNPIYIDNLNVTACPIPEIAAAGATSVSVRNSQFTIHNSPFYIEYGPHDFTQGNGTLVEIDDSVYTINGLAPLTTYDFYLRCDSSQTACFVLDSVTTSGLLQLPYCADWSEEPAYTLPSGWYRYSTYDSYYPRLDGYRQLQFYCSRNYVCAAIMPDIDIDSINRLEIFFDLYSDNCSYEAMIVGVCDDPNDFSTFTPVDTIRNTVDYDWQNNFHVSLANYQGTGHFLTFQQYNNPSSSSARYIYIRNLRIQSCLHAEITLSSATEVTVNQTSGRSDSLTIGQSDSQTFYVEYDTTGFAQGSGTVVEVTETPFTITGLQSNTSYDFYVLCDTLQPTCFPPTTINTRSTLPLPYCEDFESSVDMPAGWLRYSTYGSGYPYVYNNYYYAHNGNQSLEFSMWADNRHYAILPDFDIDSLRHVSLSFWLRMGSPTSSYIVVGVLDNPYDYSTFTPIDTLTTTVSDVYQQQHVSFENYSGTGRFITFFATSPNTYSWRYIYVDDLTIQGCGHAEITLSDATEVTVNQTSGQSDSQTIGTSEYPTIYIEYDTTGFIQGTGTVVEVNEVPFFISGLQENATYDFYVLCDTPQVACAAPVTITTSSRVDIPYCETFDYSGQSYKMPDGWRRYHSNTSSSASPYVNSSSQLYMYANSSDKCYAVLPVIDSLPVNSLSVTFDLRCSSPSYSGVIVGVMDNPDDISTFTLIDTLRCVGSDFEQQHVSFANYQGTGRFIALLHYSSYSSRTIYIDNLMVENCDLPLGIRATLYNNNTVRITADSVSNSQFSIFNSQFYIEYGVSGFALGTGTRQLCTSLPLDIPLNNYTTYDFYFLCDTALPTCRVVQTVETSGDPLELSYCENFDATTVGQLPTGWRAVSTSSANAVSYVRVTNGSAHTTNRKLQMSTSTSTSYYAVLPQMAVDSLSQLAVSFYMRSTYNSSVTVGVMSDPADPSTFLPVATFTGGTEWQRYLFALEGVHRDAHYLAFRSNPGTSSGVVYIDDVFIDSCGVHGFMVGQTESDQITLTWSKVGNPDISIEYGPMGFERGNGTVIHPNASPYTVSGLDALTSYMFYFDAVCDLSADQYCNLNYHDSVTRFTPAGGTGCIDPTNLTADYTTCFYGTYGNPAQHIGIVDYGYGDVRSRHTVHYDTTATDPRTGDMLRVVPEGAEASVRLGNWNSGGQGSAEAESIVYSLFVDTTSFDLLILKYAAVLQDPDHAIEDQPRFSLELLDDSLRLLDTVCAAANFVANSNLGWNQASNMVLWKDWTTVGVDVSPFAGQTINIRLTTYDCNEGNHYGYAYFTLGCMLKNMRSELCGDVDSNRFYAPSGFAYRWYNETNTGVTLSTEQSIGVETDNTTYYCDCSFVDNDQCSFTLSAFAGTRYPLADFTYTVEKRDCRFYVTFTNTSTISLDGSDTLITGEPCESAQWDFGNGENSDTYNASTVYNTPGTYTVTLVSGIASDSCVDTKQIQITLQRDSNDVAVIGDSAVCYGDSITLAVTGLTDSIQYATLHWSSPDSSFNALLSAFGTDTTLTVTSSPTTNYDSILNAQLSILNSNGCTDTLTTRITVFPLYDQTDTIEICASQIPYTWHYGNDSIVISNIPATNHDTTFNLQLTIPNSHGCDSTQHVNLIVHPVHNTYDTVVIIQNQLPYTIFDTTINAPFSISNSRYSVFNSQFSVLDSYGCDSLINFTLLVFLNDTLADYDTVCASALPFTWNGVTFSVLDSMYHDPVGIMYIDHDATLQNSNGADSVVHMTLFVIPTTNGIVYDTIVENDLPYTLHSGNDSILISDTAIPTINQDTTYNYQFSMLNVNGCDSILDYYLTIYTNVQTTYDTAVCASSLPLTWHDTVFQAFNNSLGVDTVIDLQFTILDSHGADSTVTLNVTVHPVHNTSDTLSIVQNQIPYTWHCGNDSILITNAAISTTTHDTTINYQFSVLNSYGCDSIINFALIVYLNDTVADYDTICASEMPVTWNGVEFSYYDDSVRHYDDGSMLIEHDATLLKANGADSLVHMSLFLIPTTFATIYDTIVENQLPYTWLDTTITVDSLIIVPDSQFSVFNSQFTILNSHGCDSIIDYHLIIYLNRQTTFDSAICASQLPLTWYCGNDSAFIPDTITINHDSIFHFQFSILNSHGADSTVTLNVTVHPLYDLRDTVVTCDNLLPYTWRDTLITIDDSLLTFDNSQFTIFDYQLSTLSSHGCDSTMRLNLTVGRSYAFYNTAAVCQNSLPYTWLDTTLSPAMPSNCPSDSIFNYQLPMLNSLGCDSVYNLTLTIHPTYLYSDTDAICQNSFPYTWLDTTLNPYISGTDTTYNYQLSIITSHGCDSLHTLNLTVYTNTTGTVYDTIVQNQLPYTYYDSVFTIAHFGSSSSITTTVIGSNSHGCDSVVNYTLTLYRNDTTSVSQTICASLLPYTWNGVTFDTTVHSQPSILHSQVSVLNSHGADSLILMTLNVNPVYLFNDTTELCANRLPYTWCDTTFNLFMGSIAERGEFVRHFQTVNHCDSTRTLLLLVHGVYTTVDHQESCNPYEWIDGVTYSADIYGPQVTLESQYGCDSVVILDFHISEPAVTFLTDSFCVSDTYSWHGRTITDGGIYYDSLLTVEGCDSIVTLNLTQLPLPQVTVDRESDCELHLYGLTVNTDVHYLKWTCSPGNWSPDWGPQTSGQVWVKPPVPATSFTVTVDYLESGICPNSATVLLDPMRVPQARMRVSPEQLNIDIDHFYALDQSLSADTRVWFVDDVFYGDDVRIECYPADGLDSVIVTLIAISDLCTDTAVQVVPIYRTTVYAPNAFTPDESTNNEFFLLMDGVVEYELNIYTRTGILLFHSTDPNQHWDGTFKGKPCPQASYVWVLRYTTEEKPRQPESKKGSVLLIR